MQTRDVITRNDAWMRDYLSAATEKIPRSREQTMFEIRKMKAGGLVMAASEFRNSRIQWDMLSLNEDETKMNTPLMRYTKEMHYVPFAKDIEHFFSMYAFCPFYIGKAKLPNGEWTPVPCAYDEDAITIEESHDKRGRYKYTVKVKETNKPVQHLLKSTLHRGPLPSGGFHSECGGVLEEHRYFEMLRSLNLSVMLREANPPVFIKRVTPANSQPNEVQDHSFEEIQAYAQSINQFGIPDPTKVAENVKLVSRDGVVVLPRMFDTTSQQPRAVSLVNEERQYQKLVQQISAIWKIPHYALDHAEMNSGMFNNRNIRTADEDRHMIVTGCESVTRCVSKALTLVYEIIYGEKNIPTGIPLRISLDIDTLQRGLELGALSETEVVDYIRHLVGISHGNTGFAHGSQKRLRNDKSAKKKTSSSSSSADSKKKKKKENESKKRASAKDSDSDSDDDKKTKKTKTAAK
jgi:hypothetical protein